MSAELASPALEAVIFDMDGVVTDTADAHAAAWKRLFDEFLAQRAGAGEEDRQPFDPERDYRRHVDGRPRYEGVAAFLRARGIELPRGRPADPPERETVCGLGNRKNAYFRAWLAENRVYRYPATARLVARLRGSGVPVGIFSASRNCEQVLRNAGLLDLFDARVDGAVAAELDLPGKPDPAMLAATAGRLGAAPARTAVLEDSLAGVEAGARGGFGWVIGIDRGDYGARLRTAGAHAVVHDAGELAWDPGRRRLHVKRLARLPLLWDRWPALARTLAGRPVVAFLDYDGTLTPIVDDPDRALLAPEVRADLAALAEVVQVGAVSGRALDQLRRLVGVEEILYAGSHGFELAGPGWRDTAEGAEAFLADLDRAEAALGERLAGIAGHAVERKPFSIAVHYRRVGDADVARVEGAVDAVLDASPRLRKQPGKKVFQVRPRARWDKGRAIRALLDRLDPRPDPERVTIYVGDDITDEDAFRVLAEGDVGIAVRDGDDRPTAADCTLRGPGDVHQFLRILRETVAGG